MVDLKIELPDGFLKPEVRCGYEVSAEMKRVWAVELDLLAEFQRVCEEYRLTYFAFGGTLLGAVRHDGFIPWDDDIDLIMPRNDYNRLLEIGSTAFCYPYFFQTPHTEHGFWRPHVQLRNSMTTGCIVSDIKRPCNKGVFIDVFVLDSVPESRLRRWMFGGVAEIMRKVGRSSMDGAIPELAPTRSDKKLKRILADALTRGERFGDWFDKYNNHLSRYRNACTRLCGHASLDFGENMVWDKAWFDESISVPFEVLKVESPAMYHEVLSRYYGPDYMELPKVLAPTAHGSVCFNTETPYTEFYGN